MTAFRIASYDAKNFAGVKALWQDAFPGDPPWNSAENAIPAKMAVQPELFLVALSGGGQVIGSIMAGYDGHRGWLYSVAVSSPHRRLGIGTALVHEAERRLKAAGCAKINLQVRSSNTSVINFYERLGYGVEERVSMGKRISQA